MLIAALVLWSGTLAAQHGHGSMKGANGGPMQDVAGVHAELVISSSTVTINVFDESNKPVTAKGFSGSVLIVSAGNRETVQLVPAGAFALKGGAKTSILAGAIVTLVLKNATGKSGQVKF